MRSAFQQLDDIVHLRTIFGLTDTLRQYKQHMHLGRAHIKHHTEQRHLQGAKQMASAE